MAFAGRTVAAGTPGSLSPDPVVRVDNVAGQDVEVVKLADGTEGSVTPIGVPSNPLSVKTFDRGSAIYDSGRTAVPAAAAALTAATVYVKRIIVQNVTAAEQAFSATNTAGDVEYDRVPIAPRERRIFDEGDAEWVGIRIHANGQATALVVRVVGRQ